MKIEDINLIVIHCAATRPSMDIGADEIRVWHVEDRGWNDIGYHFVIRRDGTVEKGRPITVQGAHVRGHNKNSIGICLVGGWSSTTKDLFHENFTLAQENALIFLLRQVIGVVENAQIIHNISVTTKLEIAGHNQFANKACPGFDVPLWLHENYSKLMGESLPPPEKLLDV